MAGMTKEEAIAELQRLSCTRDEAERFLNEPDIAKRQEISKAVQQRVKKGQGK